MKTIKTVIKLIAGLFIGGMVGLILAGLGLVLFSDITVSEYLSKLRNVEVGEGLAAVLVGILSFVVSIPVLVTVHEAGHLVFGIMSGYRLVSFRIFNYTFIRRNGKTAVKRFAVDGTGGQCLLSPPDKPDSEISAGWYNAGGVVANVIVFLIVLPLCFVNLNPFAEEFIIIFLLADLFLILTNGIPMRIGGIGNDAYNFIRLRKNPGSKRGILTQLRANALIQDGVRLKDMPEEWFRYDSNIDYGDALEVYIPLAAASRLIDMEKMEEAYQVLEELYSHKDIVMPLYVNEIACELLFTALATGRTDRAKEILDDNLRKYIETYSKVMSSKQRVLFAEDLFINNSRDKAMERYERLRSESDRYLLRGEVISDLAVMESLLYPNT